MLPAPIKCHLLKKGSLIVLKLHGLLQVTFLTRLELVLPGSGWLHTLITSARDGEDASSACRHLHEDGRRLP